MTTAQTITLNVDADEIRALKLLFEKYATLKPADELLSVALPLAARLNDKYDEAIVDQNNKVAKTLKGQIEQLNKIIERQKWQISGLRIQSELAKQMSFYNAVRNTAVFSSLIIDPDEVRLRCVKNGEFDVRPRNILAIKGHRKFKLIYLKKPVRPLGGSKPLKCYELRSTFEEILPKLQKDVKLFFRASDSFLINLFEYDLVHAASFILKEKSLRTKENDIISPIYTDFQFNTENYQKAMKEIETYKENLVRFKEGQEGVDKAGKQMDYFDSKYGDCKQ